jgi:hypothetical protein
LATIPSSGENSAPIHASAAMTTRYWTEPVAARTYQPRINASISKAHDVARSADHWKRKLGTPNGARSFNSARAKKECRARRSDALSSQIDGVFEQTAT